MPFEILPETGTASAGDNYLVSYRVPVTESWKILGWRAVNTTTVCSARLEVSSDGSVWSVISEGNMSGITAHHGVTRDIDDFELGAGWYIRVLFTYCQLNDVISADLKVIRKTASQYALWGLTRS